MVQAPPGLNPADLDLPGDGGKLKGRPLVTPVTLPSKGIPYEGRIPDGVVSISAITVKEEKIFAAAGTPGDEKTNILFTRCCDLGTVAPDELILGDRFYLLLMLRRISYGNTYGFQFKCGECGHQFRYEIDLARDLQLKEIADDWEESWELSLPMSKKRVRLRVLRGRDEREVMRLVRKSAKQGKAAIEVGDLAYSLMLGAHIQEIDGEPVIDIQAVHFVENLVGADVSAMKDSIEHMMPGINPEIEITCPNCGFVHEEALPMSTEFFRPRNS